jgi:hypothetical protein
MEMSLEWAEFVSFWSNWILVGALVVGVLSTYGIVISSNVKEAALKKDVGVLNTAAADANERSRELERKTAELRKETVAAQLELAKFKAPRALADEQMAGLSDFAKRHSQTTVFFSVASGDAEATNLMVQIGNALRSGGWNWVPCIGATVMRYPGDTPASCQTVLFGIVIQVGNGLELIRDELIGLISAAGIDAHAEPGPPAQSAVHVIVGSKPR